ncbi:MaoC family dehydratase [Xanthobacter sp. KR7-65]|uniref:MaoC family dehydratase n=1 Tax=Xanthobacter sp. KR7-65 TaxID=3156612 RepID=UPI0032B5BEB3
MTYFEDIEVGNTALLGRHTFTQQEIVAFARLYDPQPFHVDPEAARRSHFGALVASGWHTASMWMKYFVAANIGVPHPDASAPAGVAGEGALGQFGPATGFRKLQWLKPVYVGDTISYATEAREKIASKSRSQWGLLKAYNSGTNQHGDLVIDFESVVLVAKRPA